MTAVKLCGLSRLQDIEMVNEVLPEYIGFVFAKSKRQVNEGIARGLKASLDSRIKSVGVFVNDTTERIADICNEGILDIVQLHGDEDEAYIRNLKEKISKPIIKAVRVQQKEDIRKAQELSCDYLLFDTYRKDQYGGCGETFDWSLISRGNKPYFLAGGINRDNVLQAIRIANPYAVDISSSVETDGVKDRHKIIEIVSNIRSVR